MYMSMMFSTLLLVISTPGPRLLSERLLICGRRKKKQGKNHTLSFKAVVRSDMFLLPSLLAKVIGVKRMGSSHREGSFRLQAKTDISEVGKYP